MASHGTTQNPVTDPLPETAALRSSLRDDPAHQAFLVLRTAFVVAPIVFGFDKFFNILTDWTNYLAPAFADLAPLSAQGTMYVVGVIEILAGLIVALRPRLGAPIVAAWLAGIILNLLLIPGFYDVALRDVGLLLAAVALWRLSARFDAGRMPWSRS